MPTSDARHVKPGTFLLQEHRGLFLGESGRTKTGRVWRSSGPFTSGQRRGVDRGGAHSQECQGWAAMSRGAQCLVLQRAEVREPAEHVGPHAEGGAISEPWEAELAASEKRNLPSDRDQVIQESISFPPGCPLPRLAEVSTSQPCGSLVPQGSLHERTMLFLFLFF